MDLDRAEAFAAQVARVRASGVLGRSHGLSRLFDYLADPVKTLNQSGTGPAVVYNQDSTVNSADNPAKAGDIIVIYGTGEGQTAPSGVTGKVTDAPYPQFALPVSVTIDNKPSLDIRYSGGVPFVVAGVFQVNARVPTDITEAGAKKLTVKIGNGSTQDNVTVYVRP